MNVAYQVDEFYGTVYRRFCEFVRAYDGDSITIDVDLGDRLKFDNRSVRLYGVDTPEKYPNKTNRTPESLIAEKAAALEALGRVTAYMGAATNLIVVQTIKLPGKSLYDKYGRILGRLWVPINGVMLDLSARLLAENHAKPYLGGTKPPWEAIRALNLPDPTPEEVAAEALANLVGT